MRSSGRLGMCRSWNSTLLELHPLLPGDIWARGGTEVAPRWLQFRCRRGRLTTDRSHLAPQQLLHLLLLRQSGKREFRGEFQGWQHLPASSHRGGAASFWGQREQRFGAAPFRICGSFPLGIPGFPAATRDGIPAHVTPQTWPGFWEILGESTHGKARISLGSFRPGGTVFPLSKTFPQLPNPRRLSMKYSRNHP